MFTASSKRRTIIGMAKYVMSNDPSRSSKVDDFDVICKGLRNFLLVINRTYSALSIGVSEIG